MVTGTPVPSSSSGDEEIAEFFRVNHKLVRGFLINGCGCPGHEADDIAQDAFLAVRGRWDYVRTLDQPKAYLFKVAKRQFWRLQQSRAGRYFPGDPEAHLMAVPEPTDPFSEADDRLTALALVRELAPGQRQVLWLRLVDDFSVAQTAQILSVSTATVKTQLRDAKARLEDLVNKVCGDKPKTGPSADPLGERLEEIEQ